LQLALNRTAWNELYEKAKTCNRLYSQQKEEEKEEKKDEEESKILI
jgi:hypothetical protein